MIYIIVINLKFQYFYHNFFNFLYISLEVLGLILYLDYNDSMDYFSKRWRTPKWQSKMDTPEKLTTTRQRKTKQKYNTICVGHHYTQTNTNNVNNT